MNARGELKLVFPLEEYKEQIEENENAIRIYEKFGFKVKNIAYSMQI